MNEWKQSNPEPGKALTLVERARVAEMEDEIRRLRLENEFLKKDSGLLRKDATVAERCALIEAEKANYPIAWMCGLLKVPRSSFTEWRGRVVTATAARRGELAVLVGEAFEEFRQAYGCQRIARVLNARGHACSVGLVADLMREPGLRAVQPRAYRHATVHGIDDQDGCQVHPALARVRVRDVAASLVPGSSDVKYGLFGILRAPAHPLRRPRADAPRKPGRPGRGRTRAPLPHPIAAPGPPAHHRASRFFPLTTSSAR